VVLARCRSARTAATSLLNTHISAFEIESVQSLNSELGVFDQNKLDEAKAAGVTRVWVTHDGRVLYFSIFAKEFSQVLFLDFLGKAGDEKIGALIILLATLFGRRAIAWSILVAVVSKDLDGTYW